MFNFYAFIVYVILPGVILILVYYRINQEKENVGVKGEKDNLTEDDLFYFKEYDDRVECYLKIDLGDNGKVIPIKKKNASLNSNKYDFEDEILEVFTDLKTPCIIKARDAGYFLFETENEYIQGDINTLLYTMYYTEVDFLENLYPNIIEEKIDQYTQTPTLFGEHKVKYRYYSCFGKLDIRFESREAKHFIIIRSDGFRIQKNYCFKFLLEDGSVLVFSDISNPVKVQHLDKTYFNEIKIRLTDLENLAEKKLVSWLICNEEGLEIDSSKYPCLPFSYYDKEKGDYQFKDESYRLSLLHFFEEYVEKYNHFREKYIIEEVEHDREEEESCFVYLMIDTTNNFHKIGISKNPEYRERTLQSDKPTIELICTKKYPNRKIAEAIEAALHSAYGSQRIRGEWFSLTESDIEAIKMTLQ